MATSYPRVEFVLQPVPFRLLYAEDLVTAKPYRDPVTGVLGPPAFRAQAVIPKSHPQLDEMQRLILEVGLPFPNGRLPLKDGDRLNAERTAAGKKPFDIYANAMVLYVKSNEKALDGRVLIPPRLSALQGGAIVDYMNETRPLAAPFFYSGVDACGAFKFQAYAGMGSGVTCYVDRMISFNKGERIQIGKSSDDVFGSVVSYSEHVGHVTAETPSAGMAQPPANPW